MHNLLSHKRVTSTWPASPAVDQLRVMFPRILNAHYPRLEHVSHTACGIYPNFKCTLNSRSHIPCRRTSCA